MTMHYIRRRYCVPAKRGMRVVWNGNPGRITGSHGKYLRVLLDGARRSVFVHPDWRMEYQT